jgi:type IV secretion system protein TrbL
MTADIVNQLITQYTGSITNLQTGSIALGKELFNAIALISVALLGLNHLLRKNVDLSDANLELVRWLLYLDFFYAFITNFPSIYSFVYSSIQQIGNYLGTQAAGKTVDISAANIFHIGINLALKILGSITALNLFRNLLYPLVSVVAAVIILFCFASIGLELILVQIGSQIIFAGGIFLLAFSAFQWTRDYAERYVHTFFHVGIKMVFIYILVGLGVGLAQTWSQAVVNAPWPQVLDYDIAVGLATYIYYKLCLKVPDQAVSWLTGRLSMGFETNTDVKGAVQGVIKGVLHTSKMAGAIPGNIRGFVAEGQGKARAYEAARQVASSKFDAEGKKASEQEINKEAIKTLGEAKWKKIVDDTDGAKLAKSILEEIPKPKKSPKKDIRQNTSIKAEDYSI